MTSDGDGRNPDLSSSLQSDQSTKETRAKRDWHSPKIEKLQVRDTLAGTSPGVDGLGFSPTFNPGGGLRPR